MFHVLSQCALIVPVLAPKDSLYKHGQIFCAVICQWWIYWKGKSKCVKCFPWDGVSVALKYPWLFVVVSGKLRQWSQVIDEVFKLRFRYNVMARCWQETPEFRPPFDTLRRRMTTYIEEEVGSNGSCMYVEINPVYLQFIGPFLYNWNNVYQWHCYSSLFLSTKRILSKDSPQVHKWHSMSLNIKSRQLVELYI